jgi:glycosyltransferase involved in cell wall biosynthesis
MLGSVWDQDQLDQLYTHANTYLHGHSVGGTNPSMLRAMGAGTKVIAWDVVFNREVLGVDGAYFARAESLSALLEDAELNPERVAEVAAALQRRAEELYNWDSVTDSYEQLARRVAVGYSSHRQSTGRAGVSMWSLSDSLSKQPSTALSRGISS